MNQCLTCKRTTNKKLCTVCLKNPFKLEILRNRLAEIKQLNSFKKLYVTNIPDIKNLNTEKFWNEKFQTPATYRDQDAMTREKIDTIISFIPQTSKKVLDVGIGQGYLEDRLKTFDLEFDLYGIDISSIAIKQAKEYFTGKFEVGDVMDIDIVYKKDFFDVILALEVIEHISPSQIFSFYAKVAKILKPGGSVIISTPLNEGLTLDGPNPSGHVRTYTLPILQMEFEIAGFHIENLKTFYAFKKNYRLKKLLSKTFINKWQPNNVVIKAKKMRF